MCDALSRNEPSENETKVANCLTHGRRGFYDVFSIFPEQVKFVIGKLKDVYRNDAIAKKESMSAEERLRFHQTESGPVMEELKEWMDRQIVEKQAEPNSSLGKAIQYMRNRWKKLTLFLRVAGVPLTNDECERLLKTAIRHRNNSLFYKTEPGAKVGDILMSLIQTATQAGINPFQYLTAVQKNQAVVAKDPERWFPWNYEETLKTSGAPPPGTSSP
jgi:transposase